MCIYVYCLSIRKSDYGKKTIFTIITLCIDLNLKKIRRDVLDPKSKSVEFTAGLTESLKIDLRLIRCWYIYNLLR